MNIDVPALVADWKEFLLARGAMNPRSYQYMLEELQKRLMPKLAERGPEWELRYLNAVRRCATMTDEEFIRHTKEMYAPLHPDWITEMAVPDQVYIMEKILRVIQEKDCINGVLDIGCGPAVIDLFLASKRIFGGPIICIDPLPTSLKQGRELACEMNLEMIFLESFVSKRPLPIRRSIFDLVLLIDSMHWTLHWENGLREAARLLRSGGTIFLLYSEHAPRVKIPWLGAQNILKECGIGNLMMSRHPAKESRSPRIAITGTKQ